MLPPSVLIHTPPLAAPTKRRPGVVGSAATAVMRPVALNVVPTIAPPKSDKAFSIGWGPIKFHVELTPFGRTCGQKMLLVAASALLDSITCMSFTTAPYAPCGTPNCSPRREGGQPGEMPR